MNIHNFTTKGIKNNSFAMGALSLSLVSCSQIPVLGQNSLPGNLRTNGKQVETAFEAQRVVLQKSSAAIYKSRRPIGYGVVMSSDGYILTKRSELFAQDKETKISKLKEGLSIIIDEHRYKDVSLIASDIKWDLAILKVDAEKLTPIEGSTCVEKQEVTQTAKSAGLSLATFHKTLCQRLREACSANLVLSCFQIIFHTSEIDR